MQYYTVRAQAKHDVWQFYRSWPDWLRRLVQACLVLRLTKWWLENSSYVGPKYASGDPIRLYANTVGSLHQPSIRYPYHSLPFCGSTSLPTKAEASSSSWAGALAGDAPVSLSAAYDRLRFGQSLPSARVACTAEFAADDLAQLRHAIRNRQWFVEWYVDDLPMRMYIGTVGDSTGWYDFDPGAGDTTDRDKVSCPSAAIQPPPPPQQQQHDDNIDNRMFLLPHAHFILGRFGKDRLVSARLVTDFARKVDITDNPPLSNGQTTLAVNFTYTVEWRHEKTLEWPRRHSRYFRIYLFVAERLQRGAHRHGGLAGAWGRYAAYAVAACLLRYLYLQGEWGRHAKATNRTSTELLLVDTPQSQPTLPPFPWLLSPRGPLDEWKNAIVLMGSQFHVIVLLTLLAHWLSLGVSPMKRGTVLACMLTCAGLTMPVLGYAIVAACCRGAVRRRPPHPLRNHVFCLWLLPFLYVWITTQASLPRGATQQLPTWVTVRLVLGCAAAILLFAWGFAQGQRRHHFQSSLTAPTKVPTGHVSSLTTPLYAAPYILVGLWPFYFWSLHVSKGLECLWGRQFYVNVGMFQNVYIYSTLLVCLGCVGLHICLFPNDSHGNSNSNNPHYVGSLEQPWRHAWHAGATVGLGVAIQAIYFYRYESCLQGHAQTWLFIRFTALLCAILSCMCAAAAVVATVAWHRRQHVLAIQVRDRLDRGGRYLRQQTKWHWQRCLSRIRQKSVASNE